MHTKSVTYSGHLGDWYGLGAQTLAPEKTFQVFFSNTTKNMLKYQNASNYFEMA